MSDVNVETKTKREAIADRVWVDANGVETKDETLATGFTYVWKANGRKFTYMLGGVQAGDPEAMLAIFGGLTKAGNIANTWKNLPDNERGPDPIDDITDWFKGLDSGKWGEERAGGVGTRFDKAKLAEALALFDAAHQKRPASYFQAKLDAGDKVTPKGEKREILYGTYALRNVDVKRHYEALVPPTNAPDASAL
jgi:hypothetical protein